MGSLQVGAKGMVVATRLNHEHVVSSQLADTCELGNFLAHAQSVDIPFACRQNNSQLSPQEEQFMRNLTTRILVTLLLALSATIIAINVGQAQTPEKGEAERDRLSKMIEKGDTAGAEKVLNELQSKSPNYNHSLQQDFHTFFEQITACGFYPQETRLECVIDIKQTGGYGGPIGSPGSIENVLFCVDYNNSGTYDQSESVGEGSVAIHDESAGGKPAWQYAVYRDFDPRGGLRTTNDGASTTTKTNGPTLRARAVLSWFVEPTGCNYQPFWGNVVNFRIRFDPVR